MIIDEEKGHGMPRDTGIPALFLSLGIGKIFLIENSVFVSYYDHNRQRWAYMHTERSPCSAAGIVK